MLLAATLAAGCTGESPDARAEPAVAHAGPRPGESRPGRVYDVYLDVPATGDVIAITVMEPATLEGGKQYPLVLHSHGFSQSRNTSPDCPSCATGLDEDLRRLVDNGYGVISIDERGHGESTGLIRLMDPDFEGKDLVAVVDWAESSLDWLAYGRRADGRGPPNLILGAVGGSYGGAFQLTLNAIDPKRRLDAIVPEITFYSLVHALEPNGVLRSSWDIGLFGAGFSAGSGLDRAHYDPYVIEFFAEAIRTNRLPDGARDFLGYHGHGYFCEGRPIATNGPGLVPERSPEAPPPVHAMFFQGMRDPLFGFDQAFWNAQCLREAGGDVRLLSYQAGHNVLTPFLDAGGNLFQQPGHLVDDDCGTLDVHDATLAFFDEHLKGIRGAADGIPRNCLSLGAGDAVVVDTVTVGRAGVEKAVPPTSVVAGVLDAPVAVDLGIVAGPDGAVLAGLPQLALTVQPVNAAVPGEPIVLVGIGHMRATAPGVWDLVDNQLTPLRGAGEFDLPMIGGAERLAPGDRLGLLFYGGHEQFVISGSVNPAQPAIVPVTVQGRVWLPLLGP